MNKLFKLLKLIIIQHIHFLLKLKVHLYYLPFRVSYYTRCSLQKIFSLMMDAPHVFADNGINANYMLDQTSTFLDIGSGFGYPGFIASFLSKCDSIGLEIE